MSVELLSRSPEVTELDIVELAGHVALDGVEFDLDDAFTAPELDNFQSSLTSSFTSSAA